MGLPFYARPIGTSQSPQSGEPGVAFSELIAGGTTTNRNEFSYSGQNFWLPGPDLVAQRVQISQQKGLKNIIIWELSHDLDPNHQFSLLRVAFNTRQTLLGDFDADRDIDLDDYAVWKSTFGSSTDRRADMNGNGMVDAADYAMWRNLVVANSGAAPAQCPCPNRQQGRRS